ncbi:Hsp70 family protein, partial [Mycobacterium talmoniae]|uniref:Hsp70 family protein n=1 Tax=Mycobacterium talmoniae TaxID=1858794 RepID=UPI0013F4CA88
MTDSLGLSTGTTNLVAARAGHPPLARRSVLTLFDRRAPEVGVPEDNPNLTEPGLVLRGFVERVGDPVPLVAADGSSHRGEQLLAEALDALARAAGYPTPVAIAVPAHWGPRPVAALRAALAGKLGLRAQDAPPPLISDAAAAVAALYAEPGLPTRGVVALCDFGGTGSSVTLVDAASNFAPVAETVRYPEFSGDRVDEAIVNHVLAGVRSDTDPASTAAVGSLTRLRGQCRLAKERLSTETAAAVSVELPGFAGEVQLTRRELDALIAGPLDGFLNAVSDALGRSRIRPGELAAVATVGGGASMPLIGARLSERLRVPVVTTPHPASSAAVGAGILAEQGPPADLTTAAEASAPT